MKYRDSVVEGWIKHVNETGRNLTQWEQDFMERITDKFEHSGWLSEGEVEKLDQIYTERTP